MRRWVPRGDDQEHTQRCIYSEDHLQVHGLARVLRPTGGPYYGEWVDSDKEHNPNRYQGDAQVLDAISFSHDLSLDKLTLRDQPTPQFLNDIVGRANARR